jgi:di/tripeptidase
MRSESPGELAKLEKTFLGLMQQAADEENAARSTASGKITVEAKLTGNRPPGQTPQTSPLVQTAAAAIRAMGMMPEYHFGSTDSNIPISLGIPAMTIDSGGAGGDAHALTEWIDVEKTQSVRGVETALLILLSLAGM